MQSGFRCHGGVQDIRERLLVLDGGAIQLERAGRRSGNDIDVAALVG